MMKVPERIDGRPALDAGISALCELDAAFVPIVASLDDVPLRNRAPGFAGLAEIVIGQQVSKAAAASIHGRLTGLVDPLDAETLLAAGEDAMVAAGLSRAKQRTLSAIASEITGGRLDLENVAALPAEEAITCLTALPGVGPWTAEVFCLFCARHPDVFPAGDVALQHATGWVLGEKGKPDAKRTRALAARWSPLRGVAARVLYAHYGAMKGRTELPV